LSGQSVNGCDSIINVSLEYDAPIADISSVMICEGELSGTATINSVDALNFPVTLTINNSMMETVNSLPYIFDLPLGINTVTLNDVNNCMYEQMIEIIEVPVGNLSITSNLVGTNTYLLNLESDFPIVEIIWTPSSGLSCDACDSPTAIITANTTYDVTVESNQGCIVQESILLEYVEPALVSEFYVANTFDISNPPNDNFYIQSNDANAVVKEMRVFDRWGNLVFIIQNVPVNDSSQGWDGTKNGSPLVQGVYVYTATVVTPDGEQLLWGDVTLLK
jgi:gliding motility-associated-like protein